MTNIEYNITLYRETIDNRDIRQYKEKYRTLQGKEKQNPKKQSWHYAKLKTT